MVGFEYLNAFIRGEQLEAKIHQILSGVFWVVWSGQ